MTTTTTSSDEPAEGAAAAEAAEVGALSPVSDQALEVLADQVAKRLKVVRKRAPADVKKAVRDALEQVFRIVNADAPVEVSFRLRVARSLEDLHAQLSGREAFVPYFYQAGRLAVVWLQDPIKIRGCIDQSRLRDHFVRYEERIRRAHERVRYFLERCGLEVEPAPEIPAWARPYADLQEWHELLWGRI